MPFLEAEVFFLLNGDGKTLGYRGGISGFRERTDLLGGKSFFLVLL